MRCKYMIHFGDFILEADNIPDLVKLYFDNYNRIIGKSYARYVWNGKNYDYMDMDSYKSYSKYWNYYNKKRIIEQDFV